MMLTVAFVGKFFIESALMQMLATAAHDIRPERESKGRNSPLSSNPILLVNPACGGGGVEETCEGCAKMKWRSPPGLTIR